MEQSVGIIENRIITKFYSAVHVIVTPHPPPPSHPLSKYLPLSFANPPPPPPSTKHGPIHRSGGLGVVGEVEVIRVCVASWGWGRGEGRGVEVLQ